MTKYSKIIVLFLIFLLFSCSSSHSSNDTDILPDSDSDNIETVDDDSDSQSSEIVDDSDETPDCDEEDEETADKETDMNPDADVTENDDTDSDDSNSPNIDPCNPNPCSNVTNATGDCIANGGSIYSCECAPEYHWTGSTCKSNTPTDSMPLGNICTGLDQCFNYYGEAIDCPAEGEDFYGQDAQYAELGLCTPQSFSVLDVSGEKIVIDNNTGLIWLHSPLTGEHTWDEANDKCAALNDSNYAGYSDWRLPIPTELLTIVEKDWLNSAFNMQHKINPYSSDTEILWASEEYDADHAYYFGPFDGWVWNSASKTNTFQVLCVRGKGFPKASFSETMENGKSVVVDSTTGLMWQKEYIIINNWQQALAYCQTLNDEKYANHTDWRLPNKNELASLLNYDKSSVLYSDFPEMPDENSCFWSSTTSLITYNDMIWVVDFDFGVVSRNYKTKNNSLDIRYVRCVR